MICRRSIVILRDIINIGKAAANNSIFDTGTCQGRVYTFQIVYSRSFKSLRLKQELTGRIRILRKNSGRSCYNHHKGEEAQNILFINKLQYFSTPEAARIYLKTDMLPGCRSPSQIFFSKLLLYDTIKPLFFQAKYFSPGNNAFFSAAMWFLQGLG